MVRPRVLAALTSSCSWLAAGLVVAALASENWCTISSVPGSRYRVLVEAGLRNFTLHVRSLLNPQDPAIHIASRSLDELIHCPLEIDPSCFDPPTRDAKALGGSAEFDEDLLPQAFFVLVSLLCPPPVFAWITREIPSNPVRRPNFDWTMSTTTRVRGHH